VLRTNELAPSECSDVKPSDTASSVAATLPLPSSIFVGPSDVAAGESGSMSTEPTGPVSAPTHPLQAGGSPSLGGGGVLGPAGSPQVEVSTLGYSSGPAGPSDIVARSGEKVLPYSLATGIAESMQLESSSSSSLAAAPDTDRQQLALRQPPTAATVVATETAAAFEVPT